jgi:uncharacterized protein YukE
MAQIYADPERMKILSDLYIQKANRLADSQSKTLSAAQGIAQNFTGTAISGVFATAVDGIKRNYNSMYDVLNSYAGFLNGAALTYEATDESLGRAILALTGGVAVAISGGRSITLDNPSGNISVPDLNGSGYEEYRNGFKGKDGKFYQYQCVGYVKGRIWERFGVSFPGLSWDTGGASASRIRQYFNEQEINGYRVEYCTSDNVKSGSIASFKGFDGTGHVAFVEDVFTDANGTTMVRYTEANASGSAGKDVDDGIFKVISLDEFRKYCGGLKDLIHLAKVN